jgi:transitional endoplasmic reticulum ATPase
MTTGNDPCASLREALRHMPEDAALRKLLAEALLGAGRYAEAEQEYREALRRVPDDMGVKQGLAQAFLKQMKTYEAMVVVEDILERKDAPAATYVLHARLLFGAGSVERAVAQYKRGLELDPAAADAEFATQLGIGASGTSPVVDGRQRSTLSADETGTDLARPERPSVNFEKVGGMETVKEEIRIKIIHPLTHPDMYKAYGKPIGGGILMYGPPGCGKTHLARATAGEVSAMFISVGLHDVLEMWIGQSERNLHSLFEQARDTRPCVLFFDEVDALGASRADMRYSGSRQVINQFLSELDGLNASNEGVLVLGATNAPWHLDPAFRRPGRFDRIIFVPPPDLPARAEILRIHTAGKPCEQIDYDHVGKKTEGFSGADLKGVVDAAVEEKLRQAIKKGTPEPLTTKDLLRSAGGRKATTKEWFSTARNYALYSNQGGFYDDILRYLKIA